MGHGALAAGLADIPDFDTAFATSVNMARGVADGNGAHNLAVAQRVDLTGMAWNTGADQGIGWEGHRLHLAICADMEGVSPGGKVGAVLRVLNHCCVSLKMYEYSTLGEILTVCHQRWM